MTLSSCAVPFLSSESQINLCTPPDNADLILWKHLLPFHEMAFLIIYFCSSSCPISFSFYSLCLKNTKSTTTSSWFTVRTEKRPISGNLQAGRTLWSGKSGSFWSWTNYIRPVARLQNLYLVPKVSASLRSLEWVIGFLYCLSSFFFNHSEAFVSVPPVVNRLKWMFYSWVHVMCPHNALWEFSSLKMA